jgi:hypothetical protein
MTFVIEVERDAVFIRPFGIRVQSRFQRTDEIDIVAGVFEFVEQRVAISVFGPVGAPTLRDAVADGKDVDGFRIGG